MEAGVLDKIIVVLESGTSTKARENAAATISSLSVIHDYKAIIGAQPRATTALVGLLREGPTTGKRDAATALLNLALYNPNKRRVVLAGAVIVLIEMLTDEKAGITDDVLALLVSLLGCSEGLEDIRNSKDLIPLLIDILRFGSPKGKENSVILLLTLIKDEEEDVSRHLDPQCFPLLRTLAANGSSEAQRRAGALLRLLIRCCSYPAML